MKNNLKSSRRISWVDVAKGIGIFLVVWAHAIDKDSIMWKSINSFHMPLFYFLSGYIFNDSYIDFNEMVYRIRKKISELWVPFVLFSILVLFFFSIVTHQCSAALFIEKSIAIILMRDTAPLLGATWFITTIFFAQILFIVLQYIRCKLGVQKNFLVDLIFAAISFVLGFSSQNHKFGRVIVAVAFLFCGKMFKQLSQMYNMKIGGYLSYFISCILCCIVFVSSIYNKVSVADNSYENCGLFVLQAVCGIMLVISLSKMIDCSDTWIKTVLLYWGRNSVGIVYWQFVCFKVILFLQVLAKYDGVKIQDYPVNYNYNSPIWVIGYIAAGLYGSIFLHKILTRLSKIIKQRIRMLALREVNQ